jgi:hypothetical protein
MNEFPKFWFEGNLYFGWVNDFEDLKSVFEQYKGHLTRDEILDKAVNKDDKLDEFGLRIEHRGNVTLRQYLTDKGILVTE